MVVSLVQARQMCPLALVDVGPGRGAVRKSSRLRPVKKASRPWDSLGMRTCRALGPPADAYKDQHRYKAEKSFVRAVVSARSLDLR